MNTSQINEGKKYPKEDVSWDEPKRWAGSGAPGQNSHYEKHFSNSSSHVKFLDLKCI